MQCGHGGGGMAGMTGGSHPQPWTVRSRNPPRSGHALTPPPLLTQDTVNLSPAAPASLSSRHRALGNVFVRWPHWLV